MPTKARQVIVYKIKPDQVEQFLDIKAQMIEESYDLNGLYSSTTAKSLQQELVYIDTMIWESHERAESVMPEFLALPTASMFMSLIDGQPLQNLIMDYQADTLVA